MQRRQRPTRAQIASRLYLLVMVTAVLCVIIEMPMLRLVTASAFAIVGWLLHRYLLAATARGALRWAKRQVDEAITRAPSADR